MTETIAPDQIEIGGEVRLRASVSMLYTDILSQEISSALSAPQTVATLQQHLQHRALDQLSPHELQPLLESIPENLLDVAKEAAFSAGALVKRIPCVMPLAIGQPFVFRGSGLIAELELKDGRVVEIRPLSKR
ncbi:MAG: hypothetical protein ACO1RX_03950 [Candidatus Sericytochromatia bacterium]